MQLLFASSRVRVKAFDNSTVLSQRRHTNLQLVDK